MTSGRVVRRPAARRTLARTCVQWTATLLVVVLILDDQRPAPTKFAGAQLEAVGAVLSVVPVTSILATAGLVGVKLAAISRLLEALGYDRAYLTQSTGTGTAAQPIGFSTNYAYVMPYVPGLNVSVKADHSAFGQPKQSVGQQQQQQASESAPSSEPARKIFASMSLPGDYEHQRQPFRGGQLLSEIFRDAGIKIRVPTEQQQQQIQQQLNLGPQGNDEARDKSDLANRAPDPVIKPPAPPASPPQLPSPPQTDGFDVPPPPRPQPQLDRPPNVNSNSNPNSNSNHRNSVVVPNLNARHRNQSPASKPSSSSFPAASGGQSGPSSSSSSSSQSSAFPSAANHQLPLELESSSSS